MSSGDVGKTKVVVGLGNPGAKYDGTRHNVGFEVLNEIAKSHGAGGPQAKFVQVKFDGQLTKLQIGDHALILVWPLTYMNESGRCVRAVANFYKIDPHKELLVICDDLSLPLGKLRMKPKGSAGGQKGLNDILRQLGTQEVARLRVGIDPPPPQWDAADYVLGRFGADQRPTIDVAIREAAKAVLDWSSLGIDRCMNQINS